ncbi:MAG TPA: uroporphyrinogen-III C-methyltransferase [Pyrinomonadaceae bacterium]|jgi:uroporphyrin-III C-methyltransferase
MREGVRSGVLVVGHGSRREEANRDVREVARRIGVRGGYPLIEAAFLEIAHLTISEGFARLIEQGTEHITVHPYFLSPGRHTRGDIPVEVERAASLHPGITYQITEPLTAHDLVIEAAIERIRETEGVERSRAASRTCARPGTIYLVGAGPGDPGLLTIKARDLLATCDVVIYDNLVNPELLCHVRPEAERIYVGKVGGGRQTPQEEINRLLLEHGQAGKRVVRLKGGDPFLFGRGGEEAEALSGAGLLFEVVPGISSALSVPAYAGIPLTHRGLSSSVAIVTGARQRDGAHTFEALANLASADTLVVLMGVAHLREIAGDLIRAGRAAETPAAVVRWGTYEGQQSVTATLATIADEAERGGMRAPAVIIVGEVVRLRERLKWFEGSLASAGEVELETLFSAA